MLSGSSDDNGAITGINVTPLVDIILVVLIIFMATAPMISSRSMRVDLPKAKVTERSATEALDVTYTAERKLLLQGRPMSQAQVVSQLLTLPDRAVLLSADKSIPYGEVVTLLDAIRGAGVKRIGLQVAVR